MMTTEERLRAIEQLCQRINGYAQYVCQVNGPKGTSGEAKEKAITAFYERMAALELELARIHEELQLG
jgi:hypothetical protein